MPSVAQSASVAASRFTRRRAGWSTAAATPRLRSGSTPRSRSKPDFAEAFSLGGYILERGGRRRGRAALLSARAGAAAATLPAAWFNLGKLLTRQGRFTEALAALDRGLAVAPDDADALNTRSAVLRALWRLEEAAEAARDGAAAAPEISRRPPSTWAPRYMKAGAPGGGARRLQQGRRAAARLRRRDLRAGAGAARARPARRGARGVRPRRVARLPRGDQRTRLSRPDARRFRARLGGLRGALGRRQIDRRGARRALSAVAGAKRAAAARAGASTITGSATPSSLRVICR